MRSTTRQPFTIETALTLLAFLLAFSVRLLNLGVFPLSEYEAGWANQAYNLAAGAPGSVGAQPAYILLTGLLFGVFKDSEAAARFFPALAGSLLVFLPWLFKSFSASSSRMRWSGLIFAFGVALDPGLVAVSRLAGGPMMGLAFTLLAAGFVWQGSPAWAGLLAGLALMSGPATLQGLLGLGLAALVASLLAAIDVPVFWNNPALHHLVERNFWRRFGFFAAGTILMFGLFWLRFPQGLSGLAQTIPAYLSGWIQPSGVPALRLPASLLFYQPLALLLGLAAIFRAWLSAPLQPNLNRFLSLWVFCALLVSMIYPARQVVDTIWVLVSLWFLAASELSQHTLAKADSPSYLPSLGLAGAVALFIFLIWYNLLRLGNLGAQPYLYLAIIGGLTLMVLIILVLVMMGWGFSKARSGLVWGSALMMALYSLSAMWGVSQVRPNDPVELWTISPGSGQVGLLLQTLDDLSSWKYGMHGQIDIKTGLTSPGLRWALRRYTHVAYTSTLRYDQQPEIILTDQTQTAPELQAVYRGQELVWSKTALWNGVIPPNLLRWMTYRELPTTTQRIILWVRGDLFPGGLLTGSESSTGPLETVP